MTACGKWVTGYNAPDRANPDQEHRVELRTSYPCSVEPEGHEGPCAAVEQPQTISARQRWLEAQRRRSADLRQIQSGLGEHQGRPLTFAENQGTEARPHPSQNVPCPLCGSSFMAKDLTEHLRQSHGSTASMAAVGRSSSQPTAEMLTPTRADREHDQKLPEVNERPVMHNVLTDLIAKRLAIGIERYGTGLQPMNGRDAYRDLVEELVDAAVYTLQIQHERAEMYVNAIAVQKELNRVNSDDIVIYPVVLASIDAIVKWLEQ
jgi:hypothetical protein